MNKITKKMFTAILSVTFSLVALGTVTFAWFTLTNVTTIDYFDVGVSTDTGIEVALGNKNEWFSDVPKGEINAYLSEILFNQGFKGLKNVTSKDGKTFYNREDASYANELDAINGGFVEFDLRFRSLVSDQEIFLSPETTMTGNRIEWVSDARFTNGRGEQIIVGQTVPYYVANAARLSVDDGEGEGEIFVYELPDGTLGDEIDLWEFGNTAHSSFEDKPISDGAVNYYNRKHSLNPISTNGVTLAPAKTSFLGADPVAVIKEGNPVNGYFETSVTVRIWIEGWDADAIDALLTSNSLVKYISVKLQFTTTKPIGYTEEIHVERADGSYTLVKSKEFFAEVDQEVTPTLVKPTTYPDELYEKDEDASNSKGKVLADNSLVLMQFFERTKFEVSFNLNGGEIVNPTATEIKHGFTVTNTPTPTRTGYEFTGWFIDEEATKQFEEMPPNNLIVYAGWKIRKITISFNSNGGSPVTAITEDYNTGVNQPSVPEKEGHTFVGWYTDDGTFEEEYTFTTMPAEDIELFAKWDVNKYTITFVTNGGDEIDQMLIEYGTELESLPVPTFEGNNFEGWFTDDELTEPFELPANMPAENITLYAKWSE